MVTKTYKPLAAAGSRWLFRVQRSFSWLAIAVLQGSTKNVSTQVLPLTGNVAANKEQLSWSLTLHN